MSDIAEVEAAVRLYIDSWHRGEADGMERSLHDELVERRPDESAPPGSGSLAEVTKQQMVDATARGGGDDPTTPVEVVVDHVEAGIASARVETPHYLDYLHLVWTDGGWRIVHDLYRRRTT